MEAWRTDLDKVIQAARDPRAMIRAAAQDDLDELPDESRTSQGRPDLAPRGSYSAVCGAKENGSAPCVASAVITEGRSLWKPSGGRAGVAGFDDF